jgi:hypothetical protein
MEIEKTNKVGYEIEDLMEMLGGDKYYSMDNIMYVYHSLREEYEEAEYYMDILIKKEKALERKLKKCVKQEMNYPVVEGKMDSSCVATSDK